MHDKKTTPAVPESVRRMLHEHAVARDRALSEAGAVTAELARARDADLVRRAATAREALRAIAAVGPDDDVQAALAAIERYLAR